jgi:hypothetical protein
MVHSFDDDIVRYQGIKISVYATHFCLSIFFPDVIATCFGLLSGHHQAILTQIYQVTSFYNESVVSIGIKNF